MSSDRPPEEPGSAREREPPVRVFTDEALARLRLREESPAAGEAELSGPWRVSRLADGGFALFRPAEQESGEPPLAVFADRHLALMAAAALPGVGREELFRVDPEAVGAGYPLLRSGCEVGALRVFLADLARSLHVLECVVRSPAAFALLLEAAGPTVLERAGAELGLRLVALPDDKEG